MNYKTYFIIGIFIGIIITFIIGFIIFKPEIKLIKKEVSSDIPDECGLAAGSLIHQIRDEDVCKIKCRARCFSLDADYKKIEFKEGINACNSCKCYCNE